MKSIYTLYIPVKDQEQANRLKAICLEYGLPIWEQYFKYWLVLTENNVFGYNSDLNEFAIHKNSKNKTESTEEEFINILKEMKK